MSIEFEYECSKEAGFVTNPNEHKRIGYMTLLDGFGLAQPLAKDVTVYVPFNTGSPPGFKGLGYLPASQNPLDSRMARAAVVGVIENFSWGGGACDPIKLDFYISQENAMQIRMLQQQALKTTLLKSLSWWIADYDQEAKAWFEQAHPKGITGVITAHINNRKAPELEVSSKPDTVKGDCDVNVYKVKLVIVPVGKFKYPLYFATSPTKNTIRTWGVKIGS